MLIDKNTPFTFISNTVKYVTINIIDEGNSKTVGIIDEMGIGARMIKTIFSVIYKLSLYFFLYLFIIILPISLRHLSINFELTLIIAITAALFLLEKAAVHQANPPINVPGDTPVNPYHQSQHQASAHSTPN